MPTELPGEPMSDYLGPKVSYHQREIKWIIETAFQNGFFIGMGVGIVGTLCVVFLLRYLLG